MGYEWDDWGWWMGVSLISWPLLIALNGYALHVLWSWFVVPTLGVREISTVQAAGLLMIYSFVVSKPHKPDGRTLMEVVMGGIAHQVTVPLITLGLGWILRHAL